MKLSPQEVQARLESQRDSVCFIDVRSLDEFQSGHVPGARCVPLEELEATLTSLPKDHWILLGCQSGRRSQQAFERLRALGFQNLAELAGGFSAWQAAGLPVTAARKSSIPIQRQVMIVAGALVATGTLLGAFLHSGWLALPAFVGLGLFQAGLSGWCGMARLLEKMPWNRSLSSKAKSFA